MQRPALAGFCAGLGWWQTPNILYFVVPTAIWLVAARHVRNALPDALVAVPAAAVGALPWLAGRFADGTTFQNRERRLPARLSGYYKEYIHPTPKLSGPGPQRVIVGKDGDVWYTPDHYKTFVRIE